MQRRKKARENPAQKNRQPETSVAEDIMGGITQVPMGPMEMAEGGIVSFAKGGKTGRAKGEEEACYTNSRTGEKYCPPGTPQVEMPRTGQRKSFQEGGGVNPYGVDVGGYRSQYDVTPEEVEETRRRSEATADEQEITPFERMLDALVVDNASEQFGPRNQSSAAPQPSSPSTRADIPPDLNQPETTDGNFFDFLFSGSDDETPDTDQAAPQDAPFAPDPDPDDTGAGGDPDLPETPREDGLMELMRELQAEKREAREGTRERALNEALIRGGLAMAASDDPNFLSAAAEGGIGGLAGYQSAMERAAKRQGEISSDLTDLAVARETSRLRGLNALFDQQEAMREQRFSQIEVLQNQLEDINTQLVENPAMEDEAKAQLTARRDQLRQALKESMQNAGINLSSAGVGVGTQNPDYNPESYGEQ
jgi:hypothetical protein